MSRPAIVYYGFGYTEKFGGEHYRKGKGRSFIDLPTDIETAEELKEWVEEWETTKAKEILEKDFENIDNVNVWITNIVKV